MSSRAEVGSSAKITFGLLTIARAIATAPDVLLMDEPCSALDPIATAQVEELIDELILYKAPKLLGEGRNTFSKFGQKDQKLSTIGFKIGGMENLGEDLKITLTPNKR